MKRLLGILLAGYALTAVFPAAPASAQSGADLTLFVDPYPSPYIAHWEVQAGIVSLTVTNGEAAQDLVILLTIEETGGRVILEAEADPQLTDRAKDSSVPGSRAFRGGVSAAGSFTLALPQSPRA